MPPAAREARAVRSRTDLAGPLLFCSGAAALSYQVLWMRDWALLYGATANATAVVLAIYFGGLALGALLAGRMGEGPDPLVRFAALEAGVVGALAAYVLLRPALPIFVAWQCAVPGLTRAGLASAILIVPTTLLGATLPVLAAPRGPRAAGRLYVWNTAGGAVGALLAIVALRALGMRGAYLAGMGVDTLVAVAALALARRATWPPPDHRERSDESTPAGLGSALVVTTTAGFVGLAAEVLWSRGLAGLLSNSVYSVALVLTAVLLGLVVGATVAVRWRPSAQAGALLLLSLAAAIVLSALALPALPDVSLRLVTRLAVTGPGTGLSVEAMLALLVVLPAATVLGALFPLALGRAGTGATGSVLAANTLAGIGGALSGGFVLLPRLGLGGGLIALATVATAAASAVAVAPKLRVTALLATVALAGLAVAAPAVPLPWRTPADEHLLHYADGPTATVMVTSDPQGRKRLRVNGQYSLGGTSGLLLETREAHLPLLLHPAPHALLHLGVGTGDTVGAALTHPDVHVDGVELVPEALQAASWFAVENHEVLNNPHAHFVADDARHVLLAASGRWDVTIGDLYLPWTAGAAALYSLDHYRLARTHLAPGGMYCQWLPLHQLAVPDLEAIVATFVAAFPHVQLWVAYHRTLTPLVALIGTETPLVPDAAAIDARLRNVALAASAASVGLDDAAELAALYVADERTLGRVVAAPITDDRPSIEFTAPAAYFHQAPLASAGVEWLAAHVDDGDGPIAGAPAPAALRRLLLAAQQALVTADGPGELRAYLTALTLAPHLRTTRRALELIAAGRHAAGDAGTAAVIADALRVTAAVR